MKLLFFDDFRLGVSDGNTVVDVVDVVKDIPHLDPQHLLVGVIQRFPQLHSGLQQAAASGQKRPLEEVRIRSPVPHPANIVTSAANNMEDATHTAPGPINATTKAARAACCWC